MKCSLLSRDRAVIGSPNCFFENDIFISQAMMKDILSVKSPVLEARVNLDDSLEFIRMLGRPRSHCRFSRARWSCGWV